LTRLKKTQSMAKKVEKRLDFGLEKW